MKGVYFLEACKEYEKTDRVHQYVQQVYMQECRSDQPINLPLLNARSLSRTKIKQYSCLHL